jgi:hypothetical protein
LMRVNLGIVRCTFRCTFWERFLIRRY